MLAAADLGRPILAAHRPVLAAQPAQEEDKPGWAAKCRRKVVPTYVVNCDQGLWVPFKNGFQDLQLVRFPRRLHSGTGAFLVSLARSIQCVHQAPAAVPAFRQLQQR